MKIYIICSVRKLTAKEKKKIDRYVDNLEKAGHQVRLPYRNTDQNDEIGLRITEEHEQDIIWADQIHVWWNPNSIGSHWDLAQARMAKKFMAEKKIILANPEEIEITKEKSYTNVLLSMHFGLTAKGRLKELKAAQRKARKEQG